MRRPKAIAKYNLDFCSLELHENYMKAEINEGVCITSEITATLTEIALQFFKKTCFKNWQQTVHWKYKKSCQ